MYKGLGYRKWNVLAFWYFQRRTKAYLYMMSLGKLISHNFSLSSILLLSGGVTFVRRNLIAAKRHAQKWNDKDRFLSALTHQTPFKIISCSLFPCHCLFYTFFCCSVYYYWSKHITWLAYCVHKLIVCCFSRVSVRLHRNFNSLLFFILLSRFLFCFFAPI